MVPAYNEEKNILEVIKKLKGLKRFYKIIVIDDGSQDRTYEIAKKTRIIVISHKRNKGKGEAIKTGLTYIKKIKQIDGAVIIDADMQYEPKESLKIIEGLKKADFVMGYRDFSKMPFRHMVGNFVWKNVFNLFFDTNLRDTNCGLIAISKHCFEKILIHGGYIIETVMLISAIKNGLIIKQVPVKVRYKEVSTITRGIRMVMGILIFMIKEGVKYRFKK